MPTGPGGYRADTDGRVGCPRDPAGTGPCVARDAAIAKGGVALCLTCSQDPADLLQALVVELFGPTAEDE